MFHNLNSFLQDISQNDLFHLFVFCRFRRTLQVIRRDWSLSLISSFPFVTLDWWVYSHGSNKTVGPVLSVMTEYVNVLISDRTKTMIPSKSC